MRGQEQDQRRLIVRPRYSLACAELPTEPAVEQISFEYTIYHLTAGNAELILDGAVYPISSPGYAFILPGKAYQIRSIEAGSFLCIRIKREFLAGLAKEIGLDPNKWFGNVEKAALLSKREIARKVRYGYCRCEEPVKYVSQIQSRYDIYVKLVPLR